MNDIERLQEAGLATRSDAWPLRRSKRRSHQRYPSPRSGENTCPPTGSAYRIGSGTTAPRTRSQAPRPTSQSRYRSKRSTGHRNCRTTELRALRKARDLQSYEVDRYFGELFPNLGWSALSIAQTLISVSSHSSRNTTQLAVQATLTWSPNDFVVQRSLYKEAKEQLKGLEADLKGLRQAVELELASVISDLETAQELCTATLKEQSAVEAALRDQEVLFKAGETTSLQLLEREQANREAALSHIDALVQLTLAEIRLQKSLGDLDSFVRKELK